MSRFGFGISGLYKSEQHFSLSLVVYTVKDIFLVFLYLVLFSPALCVEMRTKSQSS